MNAIEENREKRKRIEDALKTAEKKVSDNGRVLRESQKSALNSLIAFAVRISILTPFIWSRDRSHESPKKKGRGKAKTNRRRERETPEEHRREPKGTYSPSR